jgi:hypothetical protein
MVTLLSHGMVLVLVIHYGIFAQRYNSSGVAQGSNFLVNSYTTGTQSRPSIATDNNGNFIISWLVMVLEKLQIMEYSLKDITPLAVAQGSNFLVNEYTTGIQLNPSIAADNNGNFIISWHGPGTGDNVGIFVSKI